MVRLIYNPKRRQFVQAPIKLNPLKWKESYLAMVEEADAQCEAMARSKNFAKHNIPIDFYVSRDAEVQYFIFHQIYFNSNWIQQYLGKDYGIKKYLKEMSKGAVKRIQQFCTQLVSEFKIDGSEVFKKYNLGRYKTYKVRIDNFNRFIYKPKFDNNEIELMTVMFHYDDEITREECNSDIEFRAKKKLMEIYNSLISDVSINPTKLNDFIDKKQSESK